jgi:type I restriction enzyme R subunit
LVPQPEQQARIAIDKLLAAAGWSVCDASQANIHASRGVAIREFPLKSGHGYADYLLYVDGKAAGVIEAKPEGATLSGVEIQSAKYSTGLPENLPAWGRPLPFSYQSTGTDKFAGQQIWARFSAPRRGSGTWMYRCQTRFTNGLDPSPRSRPVFSFHKPETLAAWLSDAAAVPPFEKGGRGGISSNTPSPRAGEKQSIPSPSTGEGQGGGCNLPRPPATHASPQDRRPLDNERSRTAQRSDGFGQAA